MKGDRTPTSRPLDKRPPLSHATGSTLTGRVYAKKASDDYGSEGFKFGRQHQRGESSGTLVSALTTDSNLSDPNVHPPQHIEAVPCDPPTDSLDERLMNNLLSKAYKNRFKSVDQMSYSISSVASSLDSSYHSRRGGNVFAESWWAHGIPMNENMSNASNQAKSEQRHERMDSKEKEFIRIYFQDLEEEKSALMAQWKSEFTEQKVSANNFIQTIADKVTRSIWRSLSYVEVFIANMPLTIGAVGLCWVTQGVIWFKFIEETIDACKAVHFFSPHCMFPEFPGCFDCDPSNTKYNVALTFHYCCNGFAILCCLLFLAKCIIAWQVVVDELSHPTTSTPCGIVCITVLCVAAGHGMVGEFLVLLTSMMHIGLSIWFLYMAIVEFHLWPDPGWFPNTVGVAYAAVKTWLYFPSVGLGIMVLCMLYLAALFPIAVFRAYYNQKVAAPVCFISLSAPSITMYAMTLMAQPRPVEQAWIDSDPTIAWQWMNLHRQYYLPVQHGMMILSVIGLIFSLHSLWVRWPQFCQKEFSPAHVAFVFPLLSHANAVQAYIAGLEAFASFSSSSSSSTSSSDSSSFFHNIVFGYWVCCLVGGTSLNLVFTYKYVRSLPKWTKVFEDASSLQAGETAVMMEVVDKKDTMPAKEDDENRHVQSPLRCQTPTHDNHDSRNLQTKASSRKRVDDASLSTMAGVIPFDTYSMAGSRGDIPPEQLRQSYTSPAVLQAHELGSLIRVRRGTEDYEQYGAYVRTRNVSSLGFDWTLNPIELRHEQATLLQWVATQAPRTRNRTLSTIPPVVGTRPTITTTTMGRRPPGDDDETGYGTMMTREDTAGAQHNRSQTWLV